MIFYQVFKVFEGKKLSFCDSKRSSGVRESKRKVVVGTRAKLCQLFASSQRLWKVGHAINTIYYGEILGGSAQHPRNKLCNGLPEVYTTTGRAGFIIFPQRLILSISHLDIFSYKNTNLN